LPDQVELPRECCGRKPALKAHPCAVNTIGMSRERPVSRVRMPAVEECAAIRSGWPSIVHAPSTGCRALPGAKPYRERVCRSLATTVVQGLGAFAARLCRGCLVSRTCTTFCCNYLINSIEETAAAGDDRRRMPLGRRGGSKIPHVDLGAADGRGSGDDVRDPHAGCLRACGIPRGPGGSVRGRYLAEGGLDGIGPWSRGGVLVDARPRASPQVAISTPHGACVCPLRRCNRCAGPPGLSSVMHVSIILTISLLQSRWHLPL
jgi:hypothetical protein